MTNAKTIKITKLAEQMHQKPSQVAIALIPYGIDVTGADFDVPLEIAEKLKGIDTDIKSLKAAPEPKQEDSRVGFISHSSEEVGAIENTQPPKLSLQDCQLISEVHEISIEKVKELERILESEEEALALATGVYDAQKHLALYGAGKALVFNQDYQRRQEVNAATRKKVVEQRLDLATVLEGQGIDIHSMMSGLQSEELKRQQALNTSLTVPFDLEQLNQAIAFLTPSGIEVNDLIQGAIVEGTPAYVKAQHLFKINGLNLKTFVNRQLAFEATKTEKKDPTMQAADSLGLTRLVNFSKVSATYTK